MEKYIRKRFSIPFISRFIDKLLQRPDYYPIRYYKKTKRSKFDLYTH